MSATLRDALVAAREDNGLVIELTRDLVTIIDQLHGGLVLLFDVDEHPGGFPVRVDPLGGRGRLSKTVWAR